MKRITACIVSLVLVALLSCASAEGWTCPACGFEADGNFCANCGEKKPEESASEWICPGCGNKASGNFCSNCGKGKPTKSDRYVNLGDMEIFQNKTKGGSPAWYTDKYDEYLTDNYGNTYAHSVSVGTGSLTYLVNYRYLTFSGTVAFPKGLASDDYRESATLKIYGDEELIAEFKEIDDGSRPESFSLNIKPYERLTLEWTCEGMNVWSDWGEYATIFDGVLVPE